MGKAHSRAWHVWLVVGLMLAITTGVIVAANRRGPIASSDFFPIGLYCTEDYYPRSPADPPSKLTVTDEFRAIAQAGFNIVHSYRFDFASPKWGNTNHHARIFLDAAEREGLKVLMGLNYATWVLGDDLDLVLERVSALKDHPALWGWVLFDDSPQDAPRMGTPLLSEWSPPNIPTQKRPRIRSITPSSGFSGSPIATTVTIEGSGFDRAYNSIATEGVAGTLDGVPSPDGTTLTFAFPFVPSSGTYKVFVLNERGKSNGMKFTVKETFHERLMRYRDAVKQVDPAHPLIITVPADVDQNYEHRNVADIYLPYMFPVGTIYPPGYPEDWENIRLEDTAKFLDSLLPVIRPPQKAFVHIQTYNLENDPAFWGCYMSEGKLECGGYGPPGPPYTRSPTKEEIRFTTYQALIHKAEGIFFLCYRFHYRMYADEADKPNNMDAGDDTSPRGNPAQWEAVASVASELKSMTPILLAPSQKRQEAGVTMTPEGRVEMMIKQYQGRSYLLTVNPSPKPVQHRIRLAPDRFPKPEIKLLPGGQKMSHQRHSFTDRWGPYDVRIFEISSGKAANP